MGFAAAYAASLQLVKLALFQECLHGRRQRCKVSCFAFPNGKHRPAGRFKGRYVLGVSLPVPCQLRFPVILVGLRFAPVRAARIAVKMPEASMNKNHFTAGSKNKIRLAGQIELMQPVTVAHSMNEPTHQHFGHHALALYTPHVLRTAFSSELVHHCLSDDQPLHSHESLFGSIIWGDGHRFLAV